MCLVFWRWYGVPGCRFVGSINRYRLCDCPDTRDHRRCLDAIGGEQGDGVSGGYLARFSPGRALHSLGLKSRRGDRPRPAPLSRHCCCCTRKASVASALDSIRRRKCNLETTLGGESLGSCVDEERSQLR